MIGHNALRSFGRGKRASDIHQRHKYIRVKNSGHVLDHDQKPLKTSARIDVFLFELPHNDTRLFLIFHKDVVPDLYHTLLGISFVEIFEGTDWCFVWPSIIKHFAAWAGRTSPCIGTFYCWPPICINAFIENMLFGNAKRLPNFCGFSITSNIFVSFKYGYTKSRRIETKPFFF